MTTSYEVVLVAVTPQSSGQPTYTELCPIVQPTDLTIVDELSGPGSITVSSSVDTLDPAGAARLINLLATPCELWVRRSTSSTVIAAGNVTGVAVEGRQLTITASGLLSYLAYWLRDSDYTATAVDQATIVQQLVDQWQAQPYSHDGIVTTALTATGVTRNLTIAGRDGKLILPLVVEMGGRDNGFDLSVDPETRQLRMWSPRRGNDLTSSVIIDARSIAKANIRWTVAPGTVATEVFGMSMSDKGGTLTSIKSNTTARATFGRAYIARSWNDISDQATLDDHTNRAVTDVSTQHYTLAPQLLPVPGFSYGDFGVGDVLTYDYDAGLGRQAFSFRVSAITMKAGSGRETMTVAQL